MNWQEAMEVLEREAAELWKTEHPEESVFNCDAETKRAYRQRVANEWVTILGNSV